MTTHRPLVLYVSGPMSGYPNFNFEAFHVATAKLRADGFVVLNPAENWGGITEIDRVRCMRLDIQQVLLADGLAMLEGWRQSAGARLEVDIAHAMEIPVMDVSKWSAYELEGAY